MKFLLVFLLLVSAANADIVENLQDASVTIRTANGQGSGVLYSRQVGEHTETFVWTAAHVLENLRKTRNVIDKQGGKRTIVEFQDAQVVQEFREGGRRIGEVVLDAKVLRYSAADEGEDLALLRIRKKNFVGPKVTVQFYLDDETPKLGTPLLHVGSLLGQFGANSLTNGILSQIGRVLELSADGVVFDQVTVTAFPGSSGGGVFLAGDGRYIGMLVRSAGEQFNFIVPIRRMHDWARRSNIEWALDPSCDVPSEDELNRLPIEDAGMPISMPELGSPTPAKPRDVKFLFKSYPTTIQLPF